ncbi:tetratricopeptide repeat protein [Piscinibacter sp.]|uniref:tetratricopeptide repeat protein n=1 Tax=Piscinibacter sp. TaxID=1903157 RepID=UPI002BBA5B3F|nr:tetratricopeptide repeat protein [Albitalea sp.]HUG26013.1 tetratricopeptide repeat protein [Albitalea sp.]
MQTFSLRELQSMLGISRAVISGLIASGFVTPSRGARREYRFTFQDVVLLRTAHGLQAAQIPPRKIVRSLQRLRATLPGELPLTGLRITAVGSEVAVKEGAAHWQVDSGQMLMDFEVVPAQGSVSFLTRTPQEAAPAEENDASDWFERGVELEATDMIEAERAYREAIRKAPDYVDPYLNLGVILCDAGRCDEAIALYREALAQCPQEPLLHFNLAIAREDAGHVEEALAAYERCMALSPEFADAHYNAARLHERLGHATKAIRHYSEYRRLQR